MSSNPNITLFAKGQQQSTDNYNDFGYFNDGTVWYETTPVYTARVTAYAAATGITDYTILDPLNIFDLGLTYYGLDTITKALYPMVTDKTSQSDMANQMKYNFMNPLDTNAAFRLQWFGGWIYSRTGALPNGVNAYANTFINSQLVINSTNHLFYYSRTQTVDLSNACEIGVADTVNAQYNQLRLNVAFASGGVSSVTSFTNTTDARGGWLGSKRASNDRETYLNGSTQNTVTTNDTTNNPNYNIYIGARNQPATAPSIALYSAKQCAFASIGDGLTDSQAQIFSTLVNNLQKALNRAVY